MNLDLRTMVIIISALSLMLSGLLALAGLHAGYARGVKHWAAANLCISAGLSFAIMPLTPETAGWWLVSGATLLSAGTGLQFVGIQAFMEQKSDWRIPLLITTVMLSQTLWFAVIHPDIIGRTIANSLVFALVNAACARMLLIPANPPLRTAYWLTGASFAALALLFFIRAMVYVFSPPHVSGLYVQLPINKFTFFLGSIIQLSLSFGFVLMLNYRLAGELQHLAARDFLTGAFNRRSLEQEAVQLLARSSRKNDVLAAMMVDVDHFKSINDRYGHAAGDKMLRHLTGIAQGTIRSGDYFSRYGGEEFCILLPSIDSEQALAVAERLRKRYEETPMRYGEESIRSTISIGIADSRHTGYSLTELLSSADKALYRAKQMGRNRVAAYAS